MRDSTALDRFLERNTKDVLGAVLMIGGDENFFVEILKEGTEQRLASESFKVFLFRHEWFKFFFVKILSMNSSSKALLGTIREMKLEVVALWTVLSGKKLNGDAVRDFVELAQMNQILGARLKKVILMVKRPGEAFHIDSKWLVPMEMLAPVFFMTKDYFDTNRIRLDCWGYVLIPSEDREEPKLFRFHARTVSKHIVDNLIRGAVCPRILRDDGKLEDLVVLRRFRHYIPPGELELQTISVNRRFSLCVGVWGKRSGERLQVVVKKYRNFGSSGDEKRLLGNLETELRVALAFQYDNLLRGYGFSAAPGETGRASELWVVTECCCCGLMQYVSELDSIRLCGFSMNSFICAMYQICKGVMRMHRNGLSHL